MNLRSFLHRSAIGIAFHRVMAFLLIVCLLDANEQTLFGLPTPVVQRLLVAHDELASAELIRPGSRFPASGSHAPSWTPGEVSKHGGASFPYASLGEGRRLTLKAPLDGTSSPPLLAAARIEPAGTPFEAPCFELAARPKSGKVQLVWAGIPDVVTYEIWRGLDAEPVDFHKIGSAAGNVATFLDSLGVNDTTHLYFVRAVGPGVACDSEVAAAHPTSRRGVLNYPPVIYSHAPANPDEGVVLTHAIRAADPNPGDIVRYGLASGPAGMIVDEEDGTLSWPAQAGTHAVTVLAFDTFGAMDEQSFTLQVTPGNRQPVADAGPDQAAFLGQIVTLDGSASSDQDGDSLTFSWTFLERPPGSLATLSDPAAVKPTFVIDRFGTYSLQLIVDDGTVASAPDTVIITTGNTPPVAHAGPDQTAQIGLAVTLDGSGSSDVDGQPLSYFWSFIERPAGSAAVLSDPAAVKPAFIPDAVGTYLISLTVHDGLAQSAPDIVRITTENSAPVAHAGADQTALVGATVVLDGSASSDVDGHPLTFFWSLTTRPPGSAAELIDPFAVKPTLTLDLPGTYVAQLIVNDGFADSAPDSVIVTTDNTPPVAHAGADQTTFVTEIVTLDGSGSTDVDGNPLTYFWSFTARPPGSTATLSDPAAIKPAFVVDRPGAYTIQLVVHDGFVESAPDTVTVTTENSAPVAHAGPDQSARVTQSVTLDASGSTDVDGDPLSYFWSFTSRPPGSGAALSDPLAVRPTFVVDLPGTYSLQLLVHDGTLDSAPDFVVITTENSPPVASAGPDQTVSVGETVTLNGSGSTDVDGDPLTYSWALVQAPDGSGAALSDPAAVDPTFVADLPGTYIAQLIVNDATADSAPDTVTVSTSNSRPAAVAGPDQNVQVGDTVSLDGTLSIDPDLDPLTYSWSLLTRPAGSSAALSDPASPQPNFIADAAGDYVVQLIVNDGLEESVPDTLMVLATERQIPVPDVVGLPEDAAQGAIRAAGLVPGPISTSHDPLVPAGHVISQDPAAGTLVALNSRVALVISLGPPQVIVPDVRGLAQMQAEDALRSAGLSVGSISTAPHPIVPAGSVISQDPLPGASVTPGTAVNLVISSGTGAPVLVSITVTPSDHSLVSGQTLQYTATGTWSDSRTEDITATVTWSSSVAGVANITSQGLASALDPGGTLIRASREGITGETPLAVNPPALASIVITPDAPIILASETIDFRATGVLTDGTSLDLTADVAWETDAPGVATINASGRATGLAEGTATIRAARDGVTGEADLAVRNPMIDSTAPVALITSPADNAVLTGPVDILGTASDDHLLKYTLEYAPADDPTFTVFATGDSPVVSDVLGQFDPSVLANDYYTIRLTVVDLGGNTASSSVVCQVVRDQKVGVFSISYIDLDVPVAGLPITIRRVYDSRDKGRGDFGIAWRMEIQTMKARANRDQATRWQVNRSGGFFPTYTLVPTSPHRISITLPDGKIEEFELTPTPSSSTLIPLDFVTAAYSPVPGTTGSLVPIGSTDLWIIDPQPGPVTLFDFASFEPYDPQAFEYTASDGRVFVINRTLGLQSIREPNGNTLTIGPNGITHSSGSSVAFDRDAQGRITRVTDPNGAAQTYEYDANGDLVRHVDPLGNATRYFYNLSHGLIEIRDPRGIRPVRNEYDADGRLVATIDADGQRIEYQRTPGVREEIIRDRLGHPTVIAYDAQGNVTAITDPLGHVSTFGYDPRGNRIAETNAMGEVTTYTFDSRDNMLSRTDPLGNTVTFTYDGADRPLTETDPLGNTRTFAYDGRGNLVSTRDRLGQLTTQSYDAAGNLLSTTDRLGQTTSATYGAAGHPVTESDANGIVTHFDYDANGNRISETITRTTETGAAADVVTSDSHDAKNQVTQRVDPLGLVTRIEYNAGGKQTATVDRNGNRTEFEYDARGNQTAIHYPDGTRELSVYDPENNRIALTDRAGHTTRYEYDPLKRLTKTIHPDGTSASLEYDAAGRLIAEIDERGSRTEREYDAGGRNTRVIDPLGNATLFAYDANGNRTAITDASGHTTLFEYDAEERHVRTIHPDGSTEVFTYDAEGRKIAEQDQAGAITQFEYDGEGRLTRVIDPLGGITTYAYEELGNLISQTDALGQVTRHAYDHLGRRIRTTLASGRQEHFQYDPNGNVIAKTSFGGDTAEYSYDEHNRLIRTRYPDGTERQFSYTPAGLKERVVDELGTTEYTYDSRERLIALTHPDGSSIQYEYDAAGNRVRVLTAASDLRHTYDALNRLTTVTDSLGNVTTYEYDAVGNRKRIVHANGVTTDYTYDSLNRLTGIVTRDAGSNILARYDYTLGPRGNRLSVVDHTGRRTDYGYDAAYRLISERSTGGGLPEREVLYTHDAAGNRLTRSENGVTVSYTYDADYRLLQEGSRVFSHDEDGRLIGWQEGAQLVVLDYNFDGQLVRAETGGQVITYAYDANGIRRQRSVGVEVRRYLIDEARDLPVVIEEHDAAGALVVRYTHGDDLISQERGGALAFYHFDGLGSTRMLTGPAGTTTDTFTFDAFGELLSRTGVTDNEFLFAGEQYDPNAGFYYLRARYYDPSTGRFITRDPDDGILFDPVSLHKYLYAGADPVNNVDPTGQFTIAQIAITSAIVGVLAGIATYVYTGSIQKAIAVGIFAAAVTALLMIFFSAAAVQTAIRQAFSVVGRALSRYANIARVRSGLQLLKERMRRAAREIARGFVPYFQMPTWISGSSPRMFWPTLEFKGGDRSKPVAPAGAKLGVEWGNNNGKFLGRLLGLVLVPRKGKGLTRTFVAIGRLDYWGFHISPPAFCLHLHFGDVGDGPASGHFDLWPFPCQ
jgi:RHS repeat-associated protein